MALEQLNGSTECSICTEVFTDPRVLPCFHTYCLQCIQTWSKDKLPGDKLSCPLCRKESFVPQEGVAGFPKNFFVEKMVRVQGLLTRAGVQSALCDMCTYRAEENDASKINSATTYCLECEENLCQSCATAHRKQKMSREHKLLQIGVKVKAEDLYAEYPPANCDKHMDETLKMYCNDCEVVICMMCYIKNHNAHRCSDIYEVVDELRKQLTTDAANVTTGLDICKQLFLNLSSQKKRFNEEISRTEVKIRQKANQLKDMIEDHKQSLLRELMSVKDKVNKEMKAAFEKIEHHTAAIESFRKYVCEVQEKGTPCDVARAASGLRDRADKLLMFDIIQRTLDDFGQTEVTFASPSFDAADLQKSVGSLQMNKIAIGEMLDANCTAELTHAIRGRSAVCGVTSLGDRVYVVRDYRTEIEVYDVNSMALQQHLPVPKLSRASGIAACPRYNCLYVSDWDTVSVHRVDLTRPNAAKNWSVARVPESLSVNSTHNVLVSCLVTNRLQEYTTLGDLVKEVCLGIGATGPCYAIQLSSGDYVVSQYTSPGAVSLVGPDGQVLRSFGQSSPQQGVKVEAMKYPVSLALNRTGDILVTDRGNNRILAVDSTLSRAQEFPINVALKRPYALWNDDARDRLYVGEMRGQRRLLVFSICWKQ